MNRLEKGFISKGEMIVKLDDFEKVFLPISQTAWMLKWGTALGKNRTSCFSEDIFRTGVKWELNSSAFMKVWESCRVLGLAPTRTMLFKIFHMAQKKVPGITTIHMPSGLRIIDVCTCTVFEENNPFSALWVSAYISDMVSYWKIYNSDFAWYC